MVGKHSGSVAHIKNKNSEIDNIRCFLHGYALTVKQMSSDLAQVLDKMTKIVNFIKAKPLNARIVNLLCEDVGYAYKTLLLQIEVRLFFKLKGFS